MNEKPIQLSYISKFTKYKQQYYNLNDFLFKDLYLVDYLD